MTDPKPFLMPYFWRKMHIFVLLTIIIAAPGLLFAQSAKDLRTVTINFTSPGWPAYAEGFGNHQIEYQMTFPINGGKISGKGFENYRILVPKDFDMSVTPPRALNHEKKEFRFTLRIEGQFSGGDGGKLTGRVIPDQNIPNNRPERSIFTGTLGADGKGKIYIINTEVDLKYAPFGECCDKNLNNYSKEIRNILVKELFDKANPYLHSQMVKVVERGMKLGHSMAQRIFNAGKTMYEAVRTKVNAFARGRFTLPPINPEAAFMKKINNAFEAARKAKSAGPVHPLLTNMAKSLDHCLALLQTFDAASDGAYQEASFAAAVGAISAYSNLAGLALALGQAAKADWDSFCETNYESEFKRFYRKIYFEGGQLPSEKIGRAGVTGRMKDFMEECTEWLSAGGGSGAQFRKMLIDFAHYKMGLSKSRQDFKVVEGRKGRLVMANRADATVLSALFQAYEQVFAMDLETERVRKATIKQYEADKKEIRRITSALTNAELGRFNDVWTTPEYNDIFCEIYHRLEDAGKLKGAGK